MSAIYSEAKKALNASAPDHVVGREKENSELETYLLDCFSNKKAVSLYVNGQPGTGKTLSVTNLLESLKENFKFKQLFINCMSIKNMASLYKILMQELSNRNENLTPSKRNTKENLAKSIDNSIMSLKTHLVLILDEVDQIETTIKATSDLYKIFNWPYLPNSKLILIGIANSLDFTDRLLPRLELKPECKPKIIKFMPYSKEEIMSIVKERLKNVQETNKGVPVIDDRALMLCASKIASSSGDIRKVLDICRRAIEVIEQDLKQSNQADTFKTISIVNMMRVFNEVNPMTNSNLDKNTMPLMQKILLCTILLCNKDLNLREVTHSKLFEKFNKICKTYASEMDSESEFINLCTMVQDNGLVEIKKAKDIRMTKISLRIDEQELREKLQDEAFMADILTNKLYK